MDINLNKHIKGNSDKIKASWGKFVSIAQREGMETKIALKILRKLLKKEPTTNDEIKYLKSQSKDILKIVTIMSTGTVSMIIPLTLEKILNKYNISIMPKEQDELKINEDELEGGKSDNKTTLDISKKFRIKKSKVENELKKGLKVELEHTKDEKLAKEIAMDHLTELPDYYTRLEDLEKKGDNYWKNYIKKNLNNKK